MSFQRNTALIIGDFVPVLPSSCVFRCFCLWVCVCGFCLSVPTCSGAGSCVFRCFVMCALGVECAWFPVTVPVFVSACVCVDVAVFLPGSWVFRICVRVCVFFFSSFLLSLACSVYDFPCVPFDVPVFPFPFVFHEYKTCFMYCAFCVPFVLLFM